jgi:uncharacterized damage-inducible protein DinB
MPPLAAPPSPIARPSLVPEVHLQEDPVRRVLSAIEPEFRRYKRLGDESIRQLDAEALVRQPPGDGNSVAAIVWHVAGNLRSRFTDFLTTDGEKPWRDRESEFAARAVSATDVRAKWEEGWDVLFQTLSTLTDADLSRTVVIRGQSLSVLDALQRSVTHASYHVGQIVFLARSLRGKRWEWLSIPPGKSDEYNRNPNREKP